MDASVDGAHDWAGLLDYPGFLIRRLWQIHVAIFLEEVEERVTPVQFSVLLVLSQKDWCEQGQIARHVGIDRSNATAVFGRLERDGLITRKRSVTDKRAVLIGLTRSAKRLVTSLMPRMIKSHRRVIDALSPDEQDVFLRMMKRIVLDKNDLGRARLRLP